MNNIEALIPEDFSGSVSVMVKDTAMFQKAFGYADRANRVKNSIDTKFATASAGKFFVAIGILKLVEAGRLSFDSTIGSILQFKLNKINPDITIEQLLTHTSGIPDYFDEEVMDEYADLWVDFPCYRIRKSSDLLPLFINKPMMYNPGEKFQYNNTGFVVLGLIIEELSGKAFDVFLQEEVFAVSGMHHTGYYEMDRLPAKCANAYIFDEEKKEFYTNIFSVDTKGSGAGGAFTTVMDIYSLWKALLSGKLISNDMVNRMLSIHASDEEDHYGLGTWIRQEDQNCIPFFQGCDPGVSFISSYDRQNDICIIVCSNMCNDVWKLEERICTLLRT